MGFGIQVLNDQLANDFRDIAACCLRYGNQQRVRLLADLRADIDCVVGHVFPRAATAIPYLANQFPIMGNRHSRFRRRRLMSGGFLALGRLLARPDVAAQVAQANSASAFLGNQAALLGRDTARAVTPMADGWSAHAATLCDALKRASASLRG